MKRIGIWLLSLVLLLAVLPTATVAAEGQIVAAEEDVILLAGSDFQVGNETTQIEKILSNLAIHGLTRADGAFFVGDYTYEQREGADGSTSKEESSEGIATLKELFRPIVGDNMIFTQGNHDHVDTVGLATDGNNDPASGKYGVFVINEDDRMEFNWWYSYDKTKAAADDLKAYLDEKVQNGWTKPIFVLNHIPLHWSNRTISQGVSAHAELLVKVLNEGGAKGLNIIYLYGHNHSSGYDDAMGGGAVYFKKGDSIEVPQSAEYLADAHEAKKKHVTYTLNFTYMNAGYIGAYSTIEPTTDATVTMSVFLVRGDEVIITRYNGNPINLIKKQYGVHNLKSAGVWHENYKESDCVIPNTLEYASSRKVTATDDVAVPYPRYNPIEEDDGDDPVDTDTTTTTTSTTTTTTATTTTEIIYGPCPDPSSIVTSTTASAATTVPQKQEDTAKIEDPKPFPLGLALGISGGILVVLGVMIFFLFRRKH